VDGTGSGSFEMARFVIADLKEKRVGKMETAFKEPMVVFGNSLDY
jgi:hypothetical protein